MFTTRRVKRKREFPFKELPLNLAGESLLSEQFDALMMGGCRWGIVGFVALVMALQEWMRWLLKTPNSPVFITVLCVMIAVPALIAFRRGLSEAWRLRMAILGERIVAEYLDELKYEGYYVFNDLEQDGFNIDHVAIGPGGVFVIETKTRSKWSDDRDVHVTYDGASVLVDGRPADRDPIKQVQAVADRVAELIGAKGDKSVPIRPVVTYPGWYVDPQPPGALVWVLSTKALPKWIRNEPQKLPDEVIKRYRDQIISTLRKHVTAGDASD